MASISIQPYGSSRLPGGVISIDPANEDEGPAPRVKRILIVEDHEMSRRLLDDILTAHGYDILQTDDPLHAFGMIRQQAPDLIIMDIQLPHISGLELTRWIKEDEDLRSIPILAVTAFAMEGDRQRILGGGCDAYVSKPLNIRSFLQTVRQILG